MFLPLCSLTSILQMSYQFAREIPVPEDDPMNVSHAPVAQVGRRRVTIDTLPNELLVKIFAEVGSTPVDGHFRNICGTRKLLPAMATSKEWRAVICGAPALWREIVVRDNSLWLAMCLRLSQNLLVNISFHASSTNIAYAQSILRPHKDRITSLIFNPFDCAQLGTCMLFDVMEQLKSLRVCVIHGHEPDATKHDGMCPLLMLPFPSLEVLRVNGLFPICVPPSPTAFSSLRCLAIGGCASLGMNGVPLSAFVGGLLKNCTLLESLNLRMNALDPVIFDIPQGIDPIAILPRLRYLAICGTVEQASNLLSHLEVGSDVTILLETDDLEDTSLVAVAARAILPSDISRSGIGILKSATRIMVDVAKGCSQDAVTITATEGMNLKHKINIAVDFYCDDFYDSPSTIFAHRDAQATYLLNALAQLPEMFPSAPVDTLVITGDVAAVDEGAWRSLFSQLPMLTTLAIHDTMAFADMTPLFRALGSPQSHGEPRPLCRHLEYIRLFDCDGQPTCMEELRKCVVWRIDQNVPLKRLRLQLHVDYEDGAPPDVSEYRAEFARLVPDSWLVIWDIYDVAQRMVEVHDEIQFWDSDGE